MRRWSTGVLGRAAWRRGAVTLALGLSLSAVIAGCGSGSSTNNPMHLVSPGNLIVASDTTYRPAEFIDSSTNQPAGYDVELADAIGQKMGLQTKVVTADFGTIIDSISGPALGQQRYDISISSFTINDSRKQKVDMIPYFQAGESLMVPKGNPKNIKSLADLCGKIVAVQDSTVEQDELTDLNGGSKDTGTPPTCKDNKARVESNSDQNLVAQLLLNGQADAAYQDEPVTNYYVKQNPDKAEIGGETVSPSPEGIVVRKDNPALETAVKNALKAIIDDGTYTNILTKWGVQSGAYTSGV